MKSNVIENLEFGEESVNLHRKQPLTQGLELTLWSFLKGSVFYHNKNLNTISVSLKGGENSFRSDTSTLHAGRGSICVMPQDQESFWRINSPIEFAHIYISDQSLRESAALYYDKDIRGLSLAEYTYVQDGEFSRLLFQCTETEQTELSLEQLGYQLIDLLICRYTDKNVNKDIFIGGLSTQQRRKVRAFIFEQISNRITIESLAKEVGLSPFHFAREFKQTFGMSPAQFILRLRLEKARKLMRTDISLSEVSVECGFSQQSHMTKYFKRCFDITPNKYRRKLSSLE